jgi:hypothetical protein
MILAEARSHLGILLGVLPASGPRGGTRGILEGYSRHSREIETCSRGTRGVLTWCPRGTHGVLTGCSRCARAATARRRLRRRRRRRRRSPEYAMPPIPRRCSRIPTDVGRFAYGRFPLAADPTYSRFPRTADPTKSTRWRCAVTRLDYGRRIGDPRTNKQTSKQTNEQPDRRPSTQPRTTNPSASVTTP